MKHENSAMTTASYRTENNGVITYNGEVVRSVVQGLMSPFLFNRNLESIFKTIHSLQHHFVDSVNTVSRLSGRSVQYIFQSLDQEKRADFLMGFVLKKPGPDNPDYLKNLKLSQEDFEHFTSQASKIFPKLGSNKGRKHLLKDAVNKALIAFHEVAHKPDILPVNYTKHLSDDAQFELFITTTKGPQMLDVRQRIYEALCIPAALEEYEETVVAEIKSFIVNNPDQPWVRRYEEAFMLGDDMSKEERLDFAQFHTEVLSHFFMIAPVPKIQEYYSNEEILGKRVRDLHELQSYIKLNNNEGSTNLAGNFNDFLDTVTHEFGHAFSDFLALQVSPYARGKLDRNNSDKIHPLPESDPLYKPALLFSFNGRSMQETAHYYASDHEGYDCQIEEKHARHFAHIICKGLTESIDDLVNPAPALVSI